MKRYMVLLAFLLLLLPPPVNAPAMAREVPTYAPEVEQVAAAQELARVYRPLLRGDSGRLTDALAVKIVRAADRHHISRETAFGLVYTESRFSVRARGRVGEIGLTQVLPATARRLAPKYALRQLYDPDTNLNLGFSYLSTLMERYHNRWFALVAYNRGPANADRIKIQGRGYPERVIDSGAE